MVTRRFMQGGKGWVGFWTQNFFAAVMDKASALDVAVRKQAEGRRMRVTGALMHAEITGTEFRLMADSRSRWLGVRKGQVVVSRVADSQKVTLEAGNYAAVCPDWPYMRMNARVCPMWKGICQQAAGNAYP
jgi:hypothetical protein